MVKVARKAAGRRRKTGFKPKGGLSKVQKKQVKALVKAPAETKYVAASGQTETSLGYQNLEGFPIATTIIAGGVSSTVYYLIPGLAQGTAGNQRLGNKISDVTFKSSWQFWLNPQLSGAPAVDQKVKVFICRSRGIKTNALLQAIEPDTLLDNGNGTCIDWLPASTQQAKYLSTYPVNKEEFTVMKIHEFRLTKNQDFASYGTNAGSSPNLSTQQHHEFTHSWKHKGGVLYPDNNVPGSGVPTNVTYFAYAVIYDNNAGTAPANPVLCNVRTHMYFKDM